MVGVALEARQLRLDLTTPSKWGAGRKPGPLARDPHRRRAPLASRHPCHVTLKVQRDVPSLRSARFVAEMERSWRRACERGRFRLVHYSIQHDHVHLIVEAASAHDLACGLKSIAARFARGVNRVFRRAGRVLADRSHVHVRRHLAKSGRALPRITRIDPASSGRWFSGWCTSAPPAVDPAAISVPRTWLMRIGGRRRGLIDESEVPGALRPRTNFPRTRSRSKLQ